ncbi:hypothetical protein EDD21DRAFT_365912 [Dissophora ornata]|nr:hypothetical protein EDD21DRAFT_365912 [Dissophora ornata]
MAHLAAVINRRALLFKATPAVPNLFCQWKSGTRFQTAIRSFSRKTKTNVLIETSELEQEIRQLERTIAEHERKLAAKRGYEESILESKQRSEAAKSVYKDLTSAVPHPQTSASPTSNNRYAQSRLPETFLQDLKITFLDTRSAKEETLKQLHSGLPSAEDLRAASTASHDDRESGKTENDTSPDALDVTQSDVGSTALERVRSLGIDKWNQLIYAIALEGNSQNAEQALQLMEEIGVQPNMESFGHLLEAYAKSGKLKKAQDTIDMILKNGLVPSIEAYSSLMKIHVRRRDITGAFHVLEALKKHHNPDVNVFTTLIKGCLNSGEYDLGWKVFDQMQHSGATPVESTYSLMIRACAKTDQVEKALDIFKTYPGRGLQPTDATFNSLIHACAMRPEYFATAFALLHEMQNMYGFEPDILTYNTLLFACSKRQDLLTARRVFQKVVQLDSEGVLKLDGITVTNFLWCIAEWKDMDVHLTNHKLRQRRPDLAQIDSASAALPVADSATADISTRPSYFMLPERPPKDEREALSEGESVFSWFLSRSAEQYPFIEPDEVPFTTDVELAQEEEGKIHDAIAIKSATSNIVLPRVSTQAPIRTRLLNAYLAMYVRHQEIEKSTEIYRQYFDHFQRKRDSWTYSAMLEGCYNWKDVDLGAEVFRDWRDWRKSTGKLTEKRTRHADYQCYRRMINLLARTNHLDESIALLEELSIAATPPNARLRSEIASAAASREQHASMSALTSNSHPMTSSEVVSADEVSSRSLSFLGPLREEAVLPMYPQLKDFPVVYTKTWELENEGARKLLLRLCHGKIDGLSSSSSSHALDTPSLKDGELAHEMDTDSILPGQQDKRRARYQKSLRNTAIKWKGEHPQEKGFYVGSRRMKELDHDLSKRGQDQRRIKNVQK